MRKYNIPLKDVKEVKQEIVECSSNAENSGDEYLYIKLNNLDIKVDLKYLTNVVEIRCFVAQTSPTLLSYNAVGTPISYINKLAYTDGKTYNPSYLKIRKCKYTLKETGDKIYDTTSLQAIIDTISDNFSVCKETTEEDFYFHVSYF